MIRRPLTIKQLERLDELARQMAPEPKVIGWIGESQGPLLRAECFAGDVRELFFTVERDGDVQIQNPEMFPG